MTYVDVFDERIICWWKGAELNDGAPLFPVFERHVLTLHSVMDVHGSGTLPYAAHMNLVVELALTSYQPSRHQL